MAHFAHLGGMVFGFILICTGEKRIEEMATIITDLKETFRRGEHLYPTDLHQCSGIHTYYANRSHVPVVQPEYSRRIRMVGTAGISPTLHPATMVTTDIYVHACRIHAHSFNMLWLYWFGALFLSFFSFQSISGVYTFWEEFCGGLLYMAAHNIFPRISVPRQTILSCWALLPLYLPL